MCVFYLNSISQLNKPIGRQNRGKLNQQSGGRTILYISLRRLKNDGIICKITIRNRGAEWSKLFGNDCSREVQQKQERTDLVCDETNATRTSAKWILKIKEDVRERDAQKMSERSMPMQSTKLNPLLFY